MPEVVEVCLTALWLLYELKNKMITDIQVVGGRYMKKPMKGFDNFKKINNYIVEKVNSKGKFLWFELKDKNGNMLYILNKFGMSGEWSFTKDDQSAVKFTIQDNNKKKTDLYFTDQRRFGTIEFTTDIKRLNAELTKLGDDLLKTEFSNSEFHDRIKNYVTRGTDKIIKTRYNNPIVVVLMEQNAKTGIGSGIGNYLAASILYHAKMSPYTKIGKLYDSKILSNKLANSIKYVIKLAYLTANIGYLEHLDSGMASFLTKLRKGISKNKANPFNFHPEIKIKPDDKFKFEVYGQDKDPYGNEVVGDNIVKDRTTWWVPTVQK